MKIRTTALLSCLLLFGAGEIAAQVPGIQLRVNPRIGLYAPLSDLGDASSTAATTASELSGSLALGLGVELDMAALPVNIRANMDYATGSEVSVTDEGGAEVGESTETTVLALAGDIMFRPIPKIILFQPYLFVGGGIKQYDFDVENLPTGSTLADTSDPTLHLGGGLDFGLGPLSLNAELGDYISWFEPEEGADSEMQHDLFATIGFSINIL